MAGLVFDSAPAFLHPGVYLKVLRSTQAPSLARSLQSLYYGFFERWEAMTGADRGAAFWAAMQRLAWAPQLFLYSADDPLCDGAKVRARWRVLGWHSRWPAGQGGWLEC